MSESELEQLKHILDSIEYFRKELEEAARSAGGRDVQYERLTRWTERAADTLAELGASEEAGRLRKASGVMVMSDPVGNLRRLVEAKDTVLVVLYEELRKHPGYWSKRLRRPQPQSQAAVKSVPRSVFLGHGNSSLWSRVQVYLKDELSLPVEAWESESRAGKHNVEVLKELLDKCGFAVIVVTAEDATAEGNTRARQNVVHEIGLFQAQLGFERVALLLQSGVEGFTNVAGLQYIPFTDDRIEQAFYDLARMLRREGLVK